ncbi:hypothetical protein DNH61_10710 [Paenibacillus sambharensis]|uniref:DUF3841 domain-containing protein n=1 Tax=Paenibacillus sambharensis TaxID=1803190 RepID=A0A2W1LM06_9BACL|nr:DUF3841 domain-containing protein [Paenibacillus sambharensis]PZD95905.1 hypothetical protein DNH61_10710 [Paenibacillus sambharensis]
MKLWTIQSFHAWEEALASGYLVGNVNFVWEEFLQPYHWMMEQMKNRLPNYRDEYPVWLWPDRPDLRHSGHMSKGKKAVLLEVNLNEENVLFSDFQAWHIVLANHYLALTEEEDLLFESGCGNMSIEESWQRIFNYDEIRQYEYWEGSEDLQAVTGAVPLSRIKHIKTFIGR